MDIDRFRKYCLSFPGTTEQVLWGNDLVFKVSEKMFAVHSLDPKHAVRAAFKCTSEKFHELIEMPNIIPAPYSARNHWVALEAMDALRNSELEALIRVSYELVVSRLSKKAQLDLTGKKSPPSKARARKRKTG